MKSFNFQLADNFKYHTKKNIRDIRFRAKSHTYKFNEWVEGEHYATKDRKNREYHYLITHKENANGTISVSDEKILAHTLQQFTGVKDYNDVDIYEGDIIRVYSVSYDEDGEITVSPNYQEGIVIYENAAFKLSNGSLLHEYIESPLHQIYVKGNVFDTDKHQLAIEYRANLLYKNFLFNKKTYYPEDIDIAFIELAKDIAKISMHEFVCYFNSNANELSVSFTLNNKKYKIAQTPDSDNLTVEFYALDNMKMVFSDNNPATLINNIINYIQDV